MEQLLSVFATIMLVLMILTFFVGDQIEGESQMFQLGSDGIALSTIAQFFCLSLAATLLKYVFFSEVLIHELPAILRSLFMLAAIFGISIVFVKKYNWFSMKSTGAWILFLLCFMTSFIMSIGIMLLKNRLEDKEIEEGLKKYRKKNGEVNDGE